MKKEVTIEEIQEICKGFIKDEKDFANRAKAKEHKESTVKMEKILDRLEKDTQKAMEIFPMFLNDKNDFIRFSFATYSLRLGILTLSAKMVLAELREKYLEFSALTDFYLQPLLDEDYEYVAIPMRHIEKICEKVKDKSEEDIKKFVEKIKTGISKFKLSQENILRLVAIELSKIDNIHNIAGFIVALENFDDKKFYLQKIENILNSSGDKLLYKPIFEYVYNYYKNA